MRRSIDFPYALLTIYQIVPFYRLAEPENYLKSQLILEYLKGFEEIDKL